MEPGLRLVEMLQLEVQKIETWISTGRDHRPVTRIQSKRHSSVATFTVPPGSSGDWEVLVKIGRRGTKKSDHEKARNPSGTAWAFLRLWVQHVPARAVW